MAAVAVVYIRSDREGGAAVPCCIVAASICGLKCGVVGAALCS